MWLSFIKSKPFVWMTSAVIVKLWNRASPFFIVRLYSVRNNLSLHNRNLLIKSYCWVSLKWLSWPFSWLTLNSVTTYWLKLNQSKLMECSVSPDLWLLTSSHGPSLSYNGNFPQNAHFKNDNNHFTCHMLCKLMY